MKKIKIILIICLLLCSTFPSFKSIEINSEMGFEKLKFHRPIEISSNDDFTKRNGVICGDGTKLDPYIISRLKIQPYLNNGISINDTDAYFIIKDCEIVLNKIGQKIGLKYLSGISFRNVINGKVFNCSCKGFKSGFGAVIVASSNCTIENTSFENNQNGMTINGCAIGTNKQTSNNLVRNCSFTYCSKNGIYFCCLPTSKKNVIDNCNIRKNSCGVCIDHLTHYNMIINCNISENDFGLVVNSVSSNNYITNNVFWNNSKTVFDNCTSYYENGKVYKGNYWFNHNPLEEYTIPGFGKNVDYYPQENEPNKNTIVAFFCKNTSVPIVNKEISFDGGISYSSKNEIKSYDWDFGDGNYANEIWTAHRYQEEGEYNVTLTVGNGILFDNFKKTIKVIELHHNDVQIIPGMSIQSAIEESRPGNRLILKPGIYYENLIINKPFLELAGSGPDFTIIDGCEKDNVIYVTSSFVTISGLSIKNSSSNQAGIQLGYNNYVEDSTNCLIEGNKIEMNSIGIEIYEGKNHQIRNNFLECNSNQGLAMFRSYDNYISSNLFFDNNYGIWMYYGSNWNDILGNDFENNYIGFFSNWSHHIMIIGNNFIRNKIGLELLNSIKPIIFYNNIYYNSEYGVIYQKNYSPEAQHNWWGSKRGPSWLLPIRGDRVISINETGKITFHGCFSRFNICNDWVKNPIQN